MNLDWLIQHGIFLSSDFAYVFVLFAGVHLCLAAVSAVFHRVSKDTRSSRLSLS